MRFLMLAVILLGLAGLIPMHSGQAGTLQSASLVLVSPAGCPAGGCAAGQRLNFKLDLNVSIFNPALSPNLQVCIFTPVNWSVTGGIEISPKGLTSNRDYTPSITKCSSAPSGYYPAGGAIATLLAGTFGDSLEFSFRLGNTASSPGSVLVQIFEGVAADPWTKTSEALSALSVIPQSATTFVADNATACGANSPCYLNSKDDLADGIGTGLKDAVDASISPATITILGSYPIKKNQVLVNKPHILKSGSTNRITYFGTVCTEPMLRVTAGATLSGLSIDDGNCSSSSRDLVVIKAADPITIENSDLEHGANAIRVEAGNTAALTVRNNHISGNTGYAILLDGSNTGVLTALTNNLYGNRAGAQVECNGPAKGTLNHNFWGENLLSSQGASHCTVSDVKRLGAPILRNAPSNPGVQVQLVTVGTTLTYAFNNAIGYRRSGTGSDFGLYIVNHGQGGSTNIPYTASQTGNPNPCSNFWDVFLADSTAPASPATLDLFFKYDLTASCVATVESTQYCGQTANPAVYPLWWFDMTSASWKPTGGTGGRPPVCLTTTKELQLTIDSSSARPGFGDLSRQAFVAALPSQPASVSLTMTSQPGDTQVTIGWVSTNEISLAGYYLQRSTSSTTGFVDISPLLPRLGIGTAGATYSYTNTGLTNNTTYYYQLRVLGLDGKSISVGSTTVMPFPATATPSFTPTDTPVYPTSTPTLTSPFQTVTNTRSVTATSLTRSVTVSVTPNSAYPAPTTQEASTALAETRAARTEIAQLSATPTPTPEPPPSENASPLTIVLAVMAAGSLVGGAIYLIHEQRLTSP
jgi:hypothetical protein